MCTRLGISILLLFFFCTSALAERIVFLGDSLTAGYGLDPEKAYPALVGKALREQGREAEVVNAGVSGDTTAGGLRRLPWVLRQDMEVLVIALGANDALRGLPVESTKENLRKMIELAREEKPGARIILAGMKAPPNMGPDYRNAFDQIYPDLAQELSVQLMPFLLDGVAGNPELNLADGIHPSPAGHRIIARNMVRFLAE